MKAKLLIISFLIACLICAFAFVSPAQDSTIYNHDGQFTKVTTYYRKIIVDSTFLIGDETWITHTKTGAKILSYSESAFQAISLKFGEMFKSINIKYKSDRHGPYKEYSIYLTQDVANDIKQWAKKNL